MCSDGVVVELPRPQTRGPGFESLPPSDTGIVVFQQLLTSTIVYLKLVAHLLQYVLSISGISLNWNY